MRELLRYEELNVNIYDRNGNTALIFSAASGDLESVKLLTADPRTDLNHRNFNGGTAFSSAVLNGHKVIAQHLLDCPRFDIESNAPIALSYAMLSHQDEMITFVLGLDFDVNTRAEWIVQTSNNDSNSRIKSKSALFTAVSLGSVPYLTQIINHRRFDPHFSGIRHALFAAVKRVDPQTFQALIPFGDINICNRRGETLFVHGCLSGSSSILEHMATLPGFAPTHREILQGLALNFRFPLDSILPILLQYEPRLNDNLPVWINGRRLDRLGSGRFDGQRLCYVGEYNSHKFPPEISIGVPLLLAAARLHKIDLVHALLGIVAVDGNARGEFGQTILFECDGNVLGDLETIVIGTRTDLNAQDLDGNTALMHAIRRLDPILIRALITHGIDLEIRNFAGVLF
jgi:hypothetical protein